MSKFSALSMIYWLASNLETTKIVINPISLFKLSSAVNLQLDFTDPVKSCGLVATSDEAFSRHIGIRQSISP